LNINAGASKLSRRLPTKNKNKLDMLVTRICPAARRCRQTNLSICSVRAKKQTVGPQPSVFQSVPDRQSTKFPCHSSHHRSVLPK
jgi:hypothetical protein